MSRVLLRRPSPAPRCLGTNLSSTELPGLGIEQRELRPYPTHQLETGRILERISPPHRGTPAETRATSRYRGPETDGSTPERLEAEPEMSCVPESGAHTAT